MFVVGSPEYFATSLIPKTPNELTAHNCANVRLKTHGGLYTWEFTKDGKSVNVQVQGQMIFNTSTQLLTAALDGYGLAYAPEDVVRPYIDNGRMTCLLILSLITTDPP